MADAGCTSFRLVKIGVPTAVRAGDWNVFSCEKAATDEDAAAPLRTDPGLFTGVTVPLPFFGDWNGLCWEKRA